MSGVFGIKALKVLSLFWKHSKIPIFFHLDIDSLHVLNTRYLWNKLLTIFCEKLKNELKHISLVSK